MNSENKTSSNLSNEIPSKTNNQKGNEDEDKN